VVAKDDFKRVMGSFAASVTVVTTVDGAGKEWGLTATAFTSLSLEPPLCLVCIDKRAGSLGALLESRKLAVSILEAGQQELSQRFASNRDDKFDGVAHHAGEVTGCPLLDGALATLECEVRDVIEGGDHHIFIGELVSLSTSEGRPLVHWRGQYADLTPR
jgi:flavin reductase (DIM6/NTAB) family NADH-FMN oxidoreductase RutF